MSEKGEYGGERGERHTSFPWGQEPRGIAKTGTGFLM